MKASPFITLVDDPQAGHAAADRADDWSAVIAGRWLPRSPKRTPLRDERLTGRDGALRRLRRLLAGWRERIRERQRLRSLCTLDERVLKDIGLTRAELRHEASKLFFRR